MDGWGELNLAFVRTRKFFFQRIFQLSQHFDPRGYKVSPNYADSVNWGQCLYWYRNHLNMDKLKKSRINPTEKELFLQTNPERSIF